eukprot:1153245-Pelagomonas_calceolata.AAC.9
MSLCPLRHRAPQACSCKTGSLTRPQTYVSSSPASPSNTSMQLQTRLFNQATDICLFFACVTEHHKCAMPFCHKAQYRLRSMLPNRQTIDKQTKCLNHHPKGGVQPYPHYCTVQGIVSLPASPSSSLKLKLIAPF